MGVIKYQGENNIYRLSFVYYGYKGLVSHPAIGLSFFASSLIYNRVFFFEEEVLFDKVLISLEVFLISLSLLKLPLKLCSICEY